MDKTPKTILQSEYGVSKFDQKQFLPVDEVDGWGLDGLIGETCGIVARVQFDSEIRTQEPLHILQSPLHQSAKRALHSEHDLAI